ncbi:hypothetical protein [Kitasatospora sp. NPDC088783]|uniref:hypothetical protein n=1 Tax=Kitasatospora sp. NPDC088783 TaxID=3364077 RepID=UPI003823414C
MTAHDTFDFGAYRWDVTAAARIAAALPVRELDVTGLPAGLVYVDAAHAAQVDLEVPVLAVLIGDLDSQVMLIDGWHRVHRARSEGRDRLPCRVLDERQELEVRLYGGSKGMPRRTSRYRPSA